MIMGIALGTNGCATFPSVQTADPSVQIAPYASLSPQLVRSLYTLVPDDVIEITVYGYPELGKQVTVQSWGGFVYPPLGAIQVSGLTVAQLEKRLTQRLQQGHLSHPQVVVTVKEHHNRHVYVLGEVHSPGVYALQDNASLFDLLEQAHGPTLEAEAYVLVYRSETVSRNQVRAVSMSFQGLPSIRIDLRTLASGERPTTTVEIHSGDTIYVPRRSSYYADIGSFFRG